jgi:hypothetical protein
LNDQDIQVLVALTENYSGSDITALAKDAAMGPLRSLGEKLLHMAPEDIRGIGFEDFESSLVNIRPSVGRKGLEEYETWAREFGERGGEISDDWDLYDCLSSLMSIAHDAGFALRDRNTEGAFAMAKRVLACIPALQNNKP